MQNVRRRIKNLVKNKQESIWKDVDLFRFQALSFRMPNKPIKIRRSLGRADIMTDTSHPEHTSEVQSGYRMWQRAGLRKSNSIIFTPSTYIKLLSNTIVSTESTCGRAIQGVGLRALDCRDRGFESR